MCCSGVCWVAAVRLGLSPCVVVSYAPCPFSMRVFDSRTMYSVVWHHLSLEPSTCYGTMEVVSGRHPSARQRAICAIFQAPFSTCSVN